MLTKGEFQDFLITVGYRYNGKSKSGFNTFEGYQTILEFQEKEKHYAFRVCLNVKDPAALKSELKQYAAENKDFIVYGGYRDKWLRLVVRMSVDSETDRNRLKDCVRFLTALYKMEITEPVCSLCGRKKKTGLYVVGWKLIPFCDTCLKRKHRQYERRRDKFEKKVQNMPAGIAGAVYGAVMGSALYVLLYQFFRSWGITAGLIVFFCFAGFVVAGRRATRKSAVICMIISGISFVIAEYMALVGTMAVLIERQNGGIAVSEAISRTNMCFMDGGYTVSVLIELGIGLLVMVLVGIGYFLKRQYTQPLKISNNVL